MEMLAIWHTFSPGDSAILLASLSTVISYSPSAVAQSAADPIRKDDRDACSRKLV